MLDKSIRELDRERMNLQSQEKKLISEIKKMAKQNQMGAVKVMAKDLVRTRHSITKFYGLKSQLQGVSLRMQTLKSSQAMADAMRGVTKAMSTMNKQLNLPSLTNIMREFERQNEKMESTTESETRKKKNRVEHSAPGAEKKEFRAARKDRIVAEVE